MNAPWRVDGSAHRLLQSRCLYLLNAKSERGGVSIMVNKDQLEQTSEGRQVLALMAENFTVEQFQPALTLIEQRYTEDLTVWDAELNGDSKLPFTRTTPAQRLLVFFDSPDRVAEINDELERREAEHTRQVEEAAAEQAAVQQIPIPKAGVKGKSKTKATGLVRKAHGRKVRAAKAVKKTPLRRQRSNPPRKRRKQKSVPAKAKKSRAKKSRKVSKRKK